MTFTIECEMKDRWVPHFLATLKRMEHLGNIGSSRHVTIFADGDGDFRPKFIWNVDLPSQVKPSEERNGDTVFDAG